jgi:hypothetical protein
LPFRQIFIVNLKCCQVLGGILAGSEAERPFSTRLAGK